MMKPLAALATADIRMRPRHSLTGSGAGGTMTAPPDGGSVMSEPEASRLRLSDPTSRTFAQLLVNVLLVSVINYTV